jgi:glutathione peroxidase
MKLLYPIIMWAKKGKSVSSKTNAISSFYDLSATAINGTQFNFAALKGKYVLIVNTASNCGYTNQYHQLQTLYVQYKNQLEIIGFPANDFKEQEKGTNQEIASFCSINFGVQFPLMQKVVVLKNNNQHPVYQWLTQINKNGWNQQQPTWNFCKYLIGPNGNLLQFLDANVDPLSTQITDLLKPIN